ncbi:MAG: single-stranded DNA-binding protein [bacterium]|nr:single-stranded DNA-binding protein [bacterium]
MNKVLLLGRITAKPELRYTPQNTPYTRFSVAVNRSVRNATTNQWETKADFINVVAWNKNAENISKFFDKGNQICLEGRIQTGSFDDKDGNKRYTTDVVLENFEFVESKNARSQTVENIQQTPYDFESSNSVNVEQDPFAEFGDSVSIDDNFLE